MKLVNNVCYYHADAQVCAAISQTDRPTGRHHHFKHLKIETDTDLILFKSSGTHLAEVSLLPLAQTGRVERCVSALSLHVSLILFLLLCFRLSTSLPLCLSVPTNRCTLSVSLLTILVKSLLSFFVFFCIISIKFQFVLSCSLR